MISGETEAVERAERLITQLGENDVGEHFPYSRIPKALQEFERQKDERNK